jgi:hypothetical protein
MPDPAVTTAVTTVAVGVLTGGAALFGQLLTQRTTRRTADLALRTTLRLERKEAYLEFLQATQEVSRVIEQRREPGPHDDEAALVLTHRMWLLQKKIALLADDDVREAGARFARKFNEAVWSGLPADVDPWWYMDDALAPFLAAARADLTGVRVR